MFRWGVSLVTLAVVAGIPGFTGMFGGPSSGASLASVVFLAAGFGAIGYDLVVNGRFARRRRVP